jgi:hypothetical protein
VNSTFSRSRSRRHPLAAVALIVFGALTAHAQAQAPSANGKKVLTIEDYARWRTIEGSRISGDGSWVAYGLRHSNALDQKPELHVRRLEAQRDSVIVNGVQPSFSDDSRWLAYFIELPYADAKKLRDDNKPVTRKAQLMNLQSGVKLTWDDIQSFSFARGSGHLLLRRRQVDTKAKHKGVDVVLHDLKQGSNVMLGNVNEAVFNRKGELLAYTVDAAEKVGNGLFVFDLRSGRLLPFDNDARNYNRLTWNEEGTALAVLKSMEVEKRSERESVLLAFSDVYVLLAPTTKAAAVRLDPATTPGFPKGMVVSDRRELLWSANKKLVFLGTKEQREARDTTEKKKSTDEVADVDVWNTRDTRIQSVQMARAENDRNFTYRAAFDVSTGKLITLADSAVRELELTLDGRWAVGRDERAYISD